MVSFALLSKRAGVGNDSPSAQPKKKKSKPKKVSKSFAVRSHNAGVGNDSASASTSTASRSSSRDRKRDRDRGRRKSRSSSGSSDGSLDFQQSGGDARLLTASRKKDTEKFGGPSPMPVSGQDLKDRFVNDVAISLPTIQALRDNRIDPKTPDRFIQAEADYRGTSTDEVRSLISAFNTTTQETSAADVRTIEGDTTSTTYTPTSEGSDGTGIVGVTGGVPTGESGRARFRIPGAPGEGQGISLVKAGLLGAGAYVVYKAVS